MKNMQATKTSLTNRDRDYIKIYDENSAYYTANR